MPSLRWHSRCLSGVLRAPGLNLADATGVALGLGTGVNVSWRKTQWLRG
eukprot:CAMPEP_0179086802 /NCGR_PEP_ID=MMETSP0796-20121207/39402_1 /TAXON_ID=73915 /ORGANISM="Pyrodinium bahamense, Strain pbaha01" /LENGTH=48 /DNA_ID= /DNA_START= /DNA_END= /DNA_ORIENTATION=